MSPRPTPPGALCFTGNMRFLIEVERETDERWIAEIPALRGVMVYGATPEQALCKVETLALRVLADKLERGELARAGLQSISFAQAPLALLPPHAASCWARGLRRWAHRFRARPRR